MSCRPPAKIGRHATGQLLFYHTREGKVITRAEAPAQYSESLQASVDFSGKRLCKNVPVDFYISEGYAAYPLSLPEIMETIRISSGYDSNYDGVINEDDYFTKLPQGKFYISIRLSDYYANKDIAHVDRENDPVEFLSGIVTIKREGSVYELPFRLFLFYDYICTR